MKVFLVVVLVILFVSFSAPARGDPVFVGQGGVSSGQSRASVRDSRGWISVVYADAGSRIYRALSTDNGLTWPREDLLNFTGTNVGGDNPGIAIDRGDTLWVAWRQFYYDSLGQWGADIFYSKYNGTSWTPASNATHQRFPSNSSDHPSLAVDPSNYPHLVWDIDGSPYKVYYCWYDGSTWTTPVIASDGGSYMPALAVDSSGDLHLAYYDGNLSYRKCVGGVWSGPTVIGSGTSPSIAVDFLGRPHVVWTSFNYPYDILYSYYDGTSWSPPLNLSNNVGLSESPTISCDSCNNLYVAWEDNSMDTTKFPRIFYCTYNGTSWSPISIISTDTTWPCDGPNIGFPVTDSGVDVVWTQWYNNQWSVMYRSLPLVVNGVEAENQKSLKVESLTLNVETPVRRELSVSYSLPFQSKVSMNLYDLSGRKVMVLDEGEKPTGRYQVRRSLGLPSGVYFLRLVSGREALTRKVVVIR